MRRTRRGKVEPRAVGSVVTGVVAQLRTVAAETSVIDFATWKSIIGSRRARRTQPVQMTNGTMIIHVEDASLLYELNLQAPSLMYALRDALHQVTIQQLQFRVGSIAW